MLDGDKYTHRMGTTLELQYHADYQLIWHLLVTLESVPQHGHEMVFEVGSGAYVRCSLRCSGGFLGTILAGTLPSIANHESHRSAGKLNLQQAFMSKEFYSVPTKDLPPRMQPRQLPNLQDSTQKT